MLTDWCRWDVAFWLARARVGCWRKHENRSITRVRENRDMRTVVFSCHILLEKICESLMCWLQFILMIYTGMTRRKHSVSALGWYLLSFLKSRRTFDCQRQYNAFIKHCLTAVLEARKYFESQLFVDIQMSILILKQPLTFILDWYSFAPLDFSR